MSEQQVKQKPKGTPRTEAIIGAASNKMVTATKALNDVVSQAIKFTETMEENSLKIADQEEKLSNLKQEFDNKRTQNKIDLDLAYKADQKEFAEKYLAANGLVSVSSRELSEMKASLLEWENKFDDKVSAEVGKANGIANSKIEAERKLLDAQYQAKEAQNLAKIQNLESQLAFATKQAETWEKQLNSERAASIERSKGQTATVNVATPK